MGKEYGALHVRRWGLGKVAGGTAEEFVGGPVLLLAGCNAVVDLVTAVTKLVC